MRFIVYNKIKKSNMDIQVLIAIKLRSHKNSTIDVVLNFEPSISSNYFTLYKNTMEQARFCWDTSGEDSHNSQS